LPADVRASFAPVAWSGEPVVDSGRIPQPTMIVRGEWDHITTDTDAKRLFEALSGTRDKRDVKISSGNHWLRLQPRREALWAEALSFMREEYCPTCQLTPSDRTCIIRK
jgi:pimeloyl-ACP methyl ester carboxylesterase